MNPTILSVVGARPQFVKAAAVSRVLRATPGLTEILVHTGQHHDREMSDLFFEELEIPTPAYHLAIAGGGHGDMTGRMLMALEPLMLAAKPDCVLVYGDTNSTLAGALAAAKLQIPVAHVEAGLRSFNRAMPEEINRVLTDHVSRWLLCPTPASIANLAREGITAGAIHVGDVMFDALLHARGRSLRQSDIAARLGLPAGGYDVATIHRVENTDDPRQLAKVCAYLDAHARERPMILPLHPRTRKAMAANNIAFSTVRTIEPVGYIDMVALVAGAGQVFTDSGGLQKEAYFLGKPCVTLRGETEWVETIESGWNRLWTVDGFAPRRAIPDYGTGQAAETIRDVLVAAFA